MRKNSISILGLLALAAGSVGVFLLFTHRPVEEGDEEEPVETVVPVHAGKIVRTTLHGYEVVYGRVEPAPRKGDAPKAHTVVRPAVDGVLVRVACHPGQAVKEGDTLFELDARVAEAEVKGKQHDFELARLELERQEKLLEAQGTSQQDCQRAERDFHLAEHGLAAARVQRDLHTVRAPISGTVLSLDATLGQTVQAAQPLAEILDTTRLVVSVNVPAQVVDRIRMGQPLQIWQEDSSQWTPIGEVTYIGETVDPESDTVSVRADVPPAISARAGRFVKARILSDSHPDCLAVSADAVVNGPDGKAYIAAIDAGRAHRVGVTRGLGEGDLIEIKGAGLSEGMDVVTEGAYGLPEQTRIDVIGR